MNTMFVTNILRLKIFLTGLFICVTMIKAIDVFFYCLKFEIIAKEVEVLRTKITLACTDCKQRNYNTMKDKKVHPDRMETKKYCKFCNKHTLHRETK